MTDVHAQAHLPCMLNQTHVHWQSFLPRDREREQRWVLGQSRLQADATESSLSVHGGSPILPTPRIQNH